MNNGRAMAMFKKNVVLFIKKKVKLSRYMPWRHMGGEEV
jgi:hypothetical protein